MVFDFDFTGEELVFIIPIILPVAAAAATGKIRAKCRLKIFKLVVLEHGNTFFFV